MEKKFEVAEQNLTAGKTLCLCSV